MLFESGWITEEEDRQCISSVLDMDTKDVFMWWAVNREQHIFLFVNENDINNDHIKCGFFSKNGVTDIEVLRVINQDEYCDDVRIHYYIKKIKYPMGAYNEEEIELINEIIKDILLELKYICQDTCNIIEETVKFDVDEEVEEEEVAKNKLDTIQFIGLIFVFIIGNIVYEMQVQGGAESSRTLYYMVHFIAICIYGVSFYAVIGISKIIEIIMKRKRR